MYEYLHVYVIYWFIMLFLDVFHHYYHYVQSVISQTYASARKHAEACGCSQDPGCNLGVEGGSTLGDRNLGMETGGLREMGGAPRNPAPRNHFLAWTAKPSGCHCTDGHLTSRVITDDRQISQSADPP